MIDVTHDGDDRRARTQIFFGVLLFSFCEICSVVGFLHCLESEFASNEFDLIEVKTLIDGDHQPQRFECKAHDFRGFHAENLREFGNCDELVDANCLAFLLGRGYALLLGLGTHVGTKTTAPWAAARWRAAHGSHGLGDVG